VVVCAASVAVSTWCLLGAPHSQARAHDAPTHFATQPDPVQASDQGPQAQFQPPPTKDTCCTCPRTPNARTLTGARVQVALLKEISQTIGAMVKVNPCGVLTLSTSCTSCVSCVACVGKKRGGFLSFFLLFLCEKSCFVRGERISNVTAFLDPHPHSTQKRSATMADWEGETMPMAWGGDDEEIEDEYNAAPAGAASQPTVCSPPASAFSFSFCRTTNSKMAFAFCCCSTGRCDARAHPPPSSPLTPPLRTAPASARSAQDQRVSRRSVASNGVPAER
jgi:hypothetical protein